MIKIKSFISYLGGIVSMVTRIIFVVTIGVILYAGVGLLMEPNNKLKGFKTLPLSDYFKAEKIPAYKILYNIKTPKIKSIFLSEEIQMPSEYNELVEILDMAENDETFKIYLNGYGGSVAGMKRIITALDNTKAKVIYIVDGDVYSAHAVLACKAEKKNISPDVMMMFHSYNSNVSLTKGSDALKYHEASTKSLTKLLVSRCSNILSHKEIEDIMSGIDLYKHF